LLGSGSEGATLAVRAGSIVPPEHGDCGIFAQGVSLGEDGVELELELDVVGSPSICSFELTTLAALLPVEPPSPEPPPHALRKNKKQTQLFLRIKEKNILPPKMKCDDERRLRAAQLGNIREQRSQ